MKSFLIELNVALSLISIVTVDTEKSSLTAIMLLFLYFSFSVVLYLYADRKGWIKNISQR